MKVMLAAVIFLVVFFFVLAVYWLEQDRRRRARTRRLKRLAAGGRRRGEDLGAAGLPAAKGLLQRRMERVFDLGPVESLLVSADAPLSLERFLLISLGGGLFLALTVAFFSLNPLALLLALAGGGGIPSLYLMNLRRKRETALVKQLPDAIDMIVRALRAGQSVDQSLVEVGRGMPEPVGEEIHTIYDEMAMGLPFETALRNFERRFARLADVKILCAAFIVQRETGGNLTKILGGLADTIRERFKLRMQVRALTAEGRTTTWVLALIPVAFSLFTWVLNPKYIGVLLAHPLGKMILFVALVLEILGIFVMSRMVQMDI